MSNEDKKQEQVFSAMGEVIAALQSFHHDHPHNTTPFDYNPTIDGDNSGCEILFSIGGVAFKIESKHIEPYEWLAENKTDGNIV